MKKIIVLVLCFALFSILITGFLIKKKNGTITNAHNDDVMHNEVIVENETSGNRCEEKTLDLYGTYNENDIEVVESYIEINNSQQKVVIPAIKGLKNKSIEEKINNDIKNRVSENMKHFDNTINIKTKYDIHGNFSNVLSISYSYIIDNADTYKTISFLTFNYELIDGNRLRFEDLFKTDTDIYSIVRRIYYKGLASEVNEPAVKINNKYYFLYDIYFDKERNSWFGTSEEYDESTGETHYEEREYIPKTIEEDINRKIKDFMNSSDKKYYFTPSYVGIVRMQDEHFIFDTIELKDIANEVVIYDKYITNENLYEKSNIGKKNIWTGVSPLKYDYMNYGFAEENLYFDISTEPKYAFEKYLFKKAENELINQLITKAQRKVEEYRKVAKENPDKFYILMIKPMVYKSGTVRDIDYILYDNTLEYYAYGSIQNKKEIMNMLLENYRYYNLIFYGSTVEYMDAKNAFENKIFDKVVKVKGNKEYNAMNLEEIKSIKEIFRDDINYLDVIKTALKKKIRYYNALSDEILERYVENASYELDLEDIDEIIKCTVPDLDKSEYYIPLYEINKSYLKIYDIYIIPDSNTRKIEKEEIIDLSLEKLNKAYNEIFARYGHDFLNKELKEYFNKLSWYHVENNKTVKLEELNEIERYNLNIIKSVIEDKKGE